ncbi:amidohydrolase family protein [Adhaeribacter radiodurans]|uniref:Amidohydrolase family protein n=1 Tax=Adhaeribacter radiodurans TaxID=2745197 RepID=A0A7L7L4A4_9BACT|nr:amidohydrolase family protein [Adhaeribacter radiodurans]QMU27626.1 amidohydrolase family protein [Adhaeribacter radiodurans]
MKIDAHQHFWQYSPSTHAWITPEMAILQRHYLPSDLQPELEQVGFAGCVAVQASQTEAETEFLLNLATKFSFIKGVVGWVDLRAENAPERLAYFAQNQLFKGVRHVVQDEPDDLFLLQPAFLKGISALQPLGLTYDILIYPRHLPVAAEFVAHFPEQKFVLDHLAKPFIKKTELQPWANDLKKLAQHPFVFAKLSGLVTEADWHNWQPQDIRPYLEVALEAFGPDRLLIGSDWPVCRLAGEYEAVMQVVLDFINKLSASEQPAILGKNAIRFYNLVK